MRRYAAAGASMAEVDECFSCQVETKYTCLNCKTFVCMRCCYFEEDDETVGWKEARCVDRCDDCFREKVKAFNARSSSCTSNNSSSIVFSQSSCRSSVQSEELTSTTNNPSGRYVLLKHTETTEWFLRFIEYVLTIVYTRIIIYYQKTTSVPLVCDKVLM